MDLPAPVSPVSAPSPPEVERTKSRSSFSISTKSRIESVTSMQGSEQAEEPAAPLVRRWRAFAGHQVVAVLVPFAAREVVAQHRGRLLRLLLDAERQVALDQAMQRLRDVRGGLIALDHHAIAVDGADVLLVGLVVAADRHLLAGQMVDGELDLQTRIAGVGRFG